MESPQRNTKRSRYSKYRGEGMAVPSPFFTGTNMNRNNERLFSASEFSALTPYSGESVRRRCREGRIPGARRDGKLWLIPESSLRSLGVTAIPPTQAPRCAPSDPIEREAFFRAKDIELQRMNRSLRKKPKRKS